MSTHRCSLLVEFAEPLTPYGGEPGNTLAGLRRIVEVTIGGALTAEDDDGHRWLIEWAHESELEVPGWAGGVAQLQPEVLSMGATVLEALGYQPPAADIVGYSIERMRK